MENKEILERLESIEILLSANINVANDKASKEAQILIEASKSINYTSNEISGLISKEKQLIEGFNPTVEVRKTYVDFGKKAYLWVTGVAIIAVISIVINILLYQEVSKCEENDIKFRLLEQFSKMGDKEPKAYKHFYEIANDITQAYTQNPKDFRAAVEKNEAIDIENAKIKRLK